MTTQIDTTKYKKLLEQEKERLEKELATIGRQDPVSGDWDLKPSDDPKVADPNERADHFEELEDNAAVLNTLEAQYNDVQRALAKIEKGTYGVCEVSGKPIEEDRLDANPAARTCIEHM